MYLAKIIFAKLAIELQYLKYARRQKKKNRRKLTNPVLVHIRHHVGCDILVFNVILYPGQIHARSMFKKYEINILHFVMSTLTTLKLVQSIATKPLSFIRFFFNYSITHL